MRDRGDNMLENLSSKIQNALNNLTGKGRLTEKEIDEAMREIRLALLEADVNFKIARQFIKNVKERAIGSDVLESLTPGQQVIKIVNEELTQLMGEENVGIEYSSSPPTVILMSGLQGAGKTTTTGKLALNMKKDNKKPLLVAADVYRPAAIKQLEVVGKQIDVDVFTMGDKIKPVDIAKASIEHAKRNQNDVVIIDTAGRLHIDEELMGEITAISHAVQPDEILLVLDAMTGQDAVNVAEAFNNALEITGVILTKLDGDARGGAALSLRAVTDKPIKYIGVGERMDQLEPFHPDRMASRILGMGDVLSLIERAEQAFDEENAKKLEERIRSKKFSFNDFLDQMEQMRNMGPLDELVKMIPGVNSKVLDSINIDEKEIDRTEAIILSMTDEERENPEIINSSRRKRIAQGSGTSVQQVNMLLRQFRETKKMMKQMADLEKQMKKGGGFNLPFFG